MTTTLKGDLAVQPSHRFAIVVSEFNEFITTRLVDSAIECITRHGGKDSQVTVVWVPGSFEIPTVAMQLARAGQHHAVLCLGAVIRGQTSHFDFVAEGVARGVAAIGPETGVPAIFGVITADTLEQAVDRAGLKHGNAGWNAACSAIIMANIMAKVPSK